MLRNAGWDGGEMLWSTSASPNHKFERHRSFVVVAGGQKGKNTVVSFEVRFYISTLVVTNAG